MLESLKRNEQFSYQKLTEEEMKSRHILGRLVGNCADFINPTRNGRKYSEELWENVFNDPLMQEKIRNGVCYGELGHPENRKEIDMEKIAICLREQPKKVDGVLKAVFDILDTPNGRILKTLCEYGSVLGVSSRGSGELITDDDGEDAVDPTTYDCVGWDVVLMPAVESARVDYVNESLNSDKKITFKQALNEEYNKANADDKKVMKETLDKLDIKIDEEGSAKITDEQTSSTKNDLNEETHEDKSTESESQITVDKKTEEANNDGSDEIIKSLQEQISANAEKDSTIQSLKEQLAVSDTKVIRINEELERYKSLVARMNSIGAEKKALEEKNSLLQEELDGKKAELSARENELKELKESKNSDSETVKSLNESISTKDVTITSLNEDLKKVKEESEKEIKKLNEDLEHVKTDSESKIKELNEQLAKQVKLQEGYRKYTEATVNKYIESKSIMLDVEPEEIISRLPSKYTIDDIDRICEDLQGYSLNISKLPFNVDRKVKRVQVVESKNDALRNPMLDDDIVDQDLLDMAKRELNKIKR